ncbi:roadblock/LC7 domain-containing protein [candidate division KSB1 bacterium]|nr:roadblock/LC7 domain-containing protein [candidate division KSB1 bacterium]
MKLGHTSNGKRLVFSETTFQKIFQILTDMIKQSRAHLCIFADMNGYPISYSGTLQDVDVSSLTALAAGTFSATSAMANIVAKEERFKYIYQEGESRNIYMSTVEEEYVLIVVFDRSVTLGMIRVMTHYTIEKLTGLIEQLKKQNEQLTQFLDVEFKALLSKEVDIAFGLK